MKTGKKDMKNVWFIKKKSVTSASRRRRKEVELGLLADFLANRLSAAGVSHIVKAPSTFRRAIWCIVILITAVAMAVMTYRVLQEYLAYPTIMRSKATSVKELEFPAVTVCGMSSVPKLFAKEAGLFYMEEMKSYLDNLPRYSAPDEEMNRCLKDPVCFWSFFDDFCFCFSNPCDTLYCYPDIDKSDDKCECSMLMCNWNGTSDSCYLEIDKDGATRCLCRSDVTYPLYNIPGNKMGICSDESHEHCDMHKPEDLPEDFSNALKSINTSEQIKNLLGKIKLSKTKDLRDVERFYTPPVNVMDNFGFPADSFILSCNFGVNNCWDFTTLYTATYGKCYMFNYVGEEVKQKEGVRKISQAGKQYGLQLFMRSRANDSLPLLARQLGVRLIIHDPRSIPVAAEEGIDVRPGDMTSISMEYTETHRLGPPWGECAEDGDTFGNYSRDPYRQNDCVQECVNIEVFHRCHCYHPKFLRATTVPHRGSICATNASEDAVVDSCFRETMDDYDHGKIECDCPAPCRQKDYEISMSTSKLNEEFFKLVKKAKSLAMINGSPAVIDSDFESSLMGVQIYYNSLFVTNIDETAIYSWESLVANVGGNMGLFLGLSLVTFMEIAEFFADIIYNAFAKRRSRASKVKDVFSYTY